MKNDKFYGKKYILLFKKKFPLLTRLVTAAPTTTRFMDFNGNFITT